MSCPSTNTAEVDDCFFCADGIHWDAHRVGWAVAGSCAAVTSLITLFTLTMHATHYQHPPAQRQVMRVLMMPAVYAVVSFFSYRYYQSYEYYILAETAYEAITLSAFLMLLMELVAMNASDKEIRTALAEKDKRKLPFPFNCFRFRASKPYFMHTLSFSVMQYVIIRPLISIIGIICEYYDVLCPAKYSVHFAEVYLDAVDFVSISIALYGLIVFYVLCKDELKGRRPLSKFLAIKLIVFFTFYQSFIFSVLQNYNVIKGTQFWTADNVSDGLSALCTTIEMVFFSIYMGWAYSWKDYTNPSINPYQRPTSFKTYLQAIWDTINLADFAIEIYLACKFFFDFLRGVPGTHSQPTKMQQTFMPDTITPQQKAYQQSQEAAAYGSYEMSQPKPFSGAGYPNGGGGGSDKPQALRSPASYQRLAETRESAESGDVERAQYAQAGVAGPTGQGDVQYPSPHPYQSNPYAQTSDAQAYGHSYPSLASGPPLRSAASGSAYSQRSGSTRYMTPTGTPEPYDEAYRSTGDAAAFPSPHPTGPAGAPGAADRISPSEWSGALRQEQQRYAPHSQTQQAWGAQDAEEERGPIPGNPRLY